MMLASIRFGKRLQQFILISGNWKFLYHAFAELNRHRRTAKRRQIQSLRRQNLRASKRLVFFLHRKMFFQPDNLRRQIVLTVCPNALRVNIVVVVDEKVRIPTTRFHGTSGNAFKAAGERCRAAAPSVTRGFELPGAGSRKRIKELQAQIHHLDNAYHHFLLGDVYFQRGKLAEAEKCYRAALQRDATDIDTRAHLGQCLVRLNRPAEARPFLESVMHEKPDHDYGHTMMALAETLTALGETDNALQYWQHITQNHSYPRAKVQLAELYIAKNQPELARAELKDVVSDDQHAPAFQRKRDRVWVRRAKSLMGNCNAKERLIFQRQDAGANIRFIKNNQRAILKLRFKLMQRVDHEFSNRRRRHVLRADLNHAGSFCLRERQHRPEIQIVREHNTSILFCPSHDFGIGGAGIADG